jgi:hypothetical protein
VDWITAQSRGLCLSYTRRRWDPHVPSKPRGRMGHERLADATIAVLGLVIVAGGGIPTAAAADGYELTRAGLASGRLADKHRIVDPASRVVATAFSHCSNSSLASSNGIGTSAANLRTTREILVMWEGSRWHRRSYGTAAPEVRHPGRQSQNDDDAIESGQCRNMARVCDWKAGSEADPDTRKRWLDLARRWRNLAAKIEAGA